MHFIFFTNNILKYTYCFANLNVIIYKNQRKKEQGIGENMNNIFVTSNGELKEKGNESCCYKMVWHEEFDGNKLDDKKWVLRRDMRERPDMNLSDESNNKVMNVSDSELKLNAIKNDEKSEFPYTTCYSVTTFDRMHFKYGFLEMRAKVPYKHGSWPSFWMKSRPGDLYKIGNRDFFAEVDIFEIFSSRNKTVPNIHKWYTDGKHTQAGCKSPWVFENCENISNEYHNYGFLWTEKEMTFYVDRIKYYSFDLTKSYDDDPDMKSFHDPMFIIINNHLFTPLSAWKPEGATVDENSEFPMEYWIDWIRLYQNDDSCELYLKQ